MARIGKKTKTILWISAALFVLLAGAFVLEYFVIQTPLFDRSGWDNTDDGTVRYLDYYGRPLKQWQSVDGDRYYFDPTTGVMQTGWLELSAGRYYLSDKGVMQTGWLELSDGRYYLADTGIMQTGWLETEGAGYYFKEDGRMYSGWLDLDTGRYFLDESGVLAVGWKEIDAGRYYFDGDGAMQTGWLELPDGRYYLADTGIMQTGWADTPDGRRYFDSQGLLQENWRETEAGRHYLQPDGKYLTGWLEIENGRYYFNQDGVQQTGWITDTKGRYYLYEDGTFATGFVEIDGVKRYFMPTGEYIILANRWNPVPKDYNLNLVKIGSFRVDASCLESLQQMMADCKAAGYSCQLNSTYRSVATQQAMWDTRYKKYTSQGYSGEEANRIIGQSVAVPGTSEHHTGLAVDIKGSNGMYAWLAKNSWKYGFILRYPDNKIDITGIIYEPWHFRYVGSVMAKDIYDSGLTLEEYFTKLEASAQ